MFAGEKEFEEARRLKIHFDAEFKYLDTIPIHNATLQVILQIDMSSRGQKCTVIPDTPKSNTPVSTPVSLSSATTSIIVPTAKRKMDEFKKTLKPICTDLPFKSDHPEFLNKRLCRIRDHLREQERKQE